MSTKNLSIKYSPVRIGFLVRDGNIGDLVTVAGINTLLYGGLHNPIIPISENNDFAERLLEIFNIDVLYPISSNVHIDTFAAEHPYLHAPNFVSTELFYEDSETRKNKLMYLDVINIINYYWEEEFKHKTRRLIEDYYRYLIVEWSDEHPLKDLFSLLFGFYPTNLNLESDFESSFLSGLHGSKKRLSDQEVFSPTLYRSITPILLTSLELENYDEKLYGNGVYIGDEDDFTDLYLFWNTRATGTRVEFLPRNHLQQFDGVIKQYLSGLIESQSPTSENNARVTAYCQSKKYEEIKELVKSIPSDKPISVLPFDVDVIWNSWNLRPASTYFGNAQTLASIDQSSNKYKVSFNLPDVPMVRRQERRIERQTFVTSIDAMQEADVYPDHTLKPPFIRTLNAFYGHKIVGNPYQIRVEKYGIKVITECEDYSLSLSPISYQSIITQIFDLAGLKLETSQPGVITKQILQQLGGLEGGRIFKITGVRRLLNSLDKDDVVAESSAKEIIFRRTWFREIDLRSLLGEDYDAVVEKCFSFNDERKRFRWNEHIKGITDIDDQRLKELYHPDFKNFEGLYIEARAETRLKTGSVFRFLLKRDFFRAGVELACDQCELKSWLSLREIDDYWVCNYCGGRNQTSPHLGNECHWKYRKSGLFAKDNNQEGAIPVILTLLQLHRQFSHFGYGYSPALKIRGNSVNCEIDLCVLQYQIGEQIEMGIAECKSEGGEITTDDIMKFKAVQDKLNSIGIKCSLIFSKTAESFRPEEIILFDALGDENINCILLLNKELEPYYPYEAYERHELTDKHPNTLEAMARNSRKIYLKK
jgi:hypothetical protein